MPSLGLSLPLSGSSCLSPSSLPPMRDGLVHCQLALLWYLLSPLFCQWTWQCLRLELFVGKFSLSVSCLFFFFFPRFLSLAIPQFGLLSYVSSLRLHSGPVLSLSNAACTSQFSPRLLVVDMSVWATSSLGVAVRCVLCGFYLFFSSQLNSPQTLQ